MVKSENLKLKQQLKQQNETIENLTIEINKINYIIEYKNKRIAYLEDRLYHSLTTKTQQYGISEYGTSDYNLISNNNVSSNSVGGIYKVKANTIIRNNIGYPTENHGIYTLNANGTTTSFTIPHGLVSTPNYVNITPINGAPYPDKITADATNITLTFNTAPASGTYKYWWEAKL